METTKTLKFVDLRVPRKLSAWIRLALKDAEAVAKRPNVVFHMSNWMTLFRDQSKRVKCSICFAGAVMLGHLEKTPAKLLGRKEFADFQARHCGTRLYNKMRALNYARVGELTIAVETFYNGRVTVPLHISRELSMISHSLEAYNDGFVLDMQRRANLLERLGY